MESFHIGKTSRNSSFIQCLKQILNKFLSKKQRVTDDILAMARPRTSLIKNGNLIHNMKK